jgi:hypothetical protein
MSALVMQTQADTSVILVLCAGSLHTEDDQ